MLTSWGVAATIVADGRSALAALEQARAAGRMFRLVLLDARMPDLDGFAVAERIRQEPGLAGVTVMLLTSDVMSGDLARCRQLGVARHLVKPLTPSELLNAVLLALGQSPAVASPAAQGRAEGPRGLHVLVAEDNPVNQVLIVRLLEKLGHTSFLAANGEEALRAYEAQVFDAVLMDVQMPVMDGLSATAAIREREARDPSRRRVPIMAVTAFALRGDRERCLAAGMDDYLTKPIKPNDLAVALNRLFAAEPPAPTPGASAPGEPAAGAGFDFSAALSYVGGDRALLDELLGIFAEDAPMRMDAIRMAIAGGDAQQLMREAHTLKGALKVLGAAAAAGLALHLENLGRDGDLSRAREAGAALERAMDRLNQELLASRRG
jgi:CheY-like chemotaxis protein/HPt (histidine-containing phosphotransfer) domain-containing protein